MTKRLIVHATCVVRGETRSHPSRMKVGSLTARALFFCPALLPLLNTVMFQITALSLPQPSPGYAESHVCRDLPYAFKPLCFRPGKRRFRQERTRRICLCVMEALRRAVDAGRRRRELDRRCEILVVRRCFRAWRVLRARSTLTPKVDRFPKRHSEPVVS